jgi:hypothetical protein
MLTVAPIRTRTIAVLLAAVVALPAVAGANPIPVWDHYETFLVGNVPTLSVPIMLQDQFGMGPYQATLLEQFGVPASKNNEPISFPDLHYTWWRIQGPEPVRRVIASNQFGDHELMLGDAVFLWNPALKNPVPGQTLPFANHYKCYQATGQPIVRMVTLQSQFGFETVTVKEPQVFCNPAIKTDPTGVEHPIVDPVLHYTCYRIEPPRLVDVWEPVLDQFLFEPLLFTFSEYLCVPTMKSGVVSTGSSTWGRLKVLYR